MNEEFPNNSNQENTEATSSENIEKTTVTYEEVLNLLRNLKTKGIDNPLDDENPDTQEFLEAESAWKESQKLPLTGAETTEQATGLIKVITLLVEAGYSDKDSIKDALDSLAVEKQLAEQKENNESVILAFESEIDRLENILSENKPEKSIPALIEESIDEARVEAENEKFMGANRIITQVLLMTRYKKFFTANPDKKVELKELQEKYKIAWWDQRGF